MKDIRKIKKYANILINTSNSSNRNINIVIDNLLSFKNILKSVPELRYLLSSKRISLNDKINSIKNIFNDYYGPIGIGSIIILIENNDIIIFNDIVDKIISIVDVKNNTKKVHVTSHKQCSDQEQQEIVLAIKNKFGDISETTFSVDQEILGGIKVRIGNKIIDGSISTKLKRIKESLLSI